MASESTPEREEREAFERWLHSVRAGWQCLKAAEGNYLTFEAYLLARQTYQMEIDSDG